MIFEFEELAIDQFRYEDFEALTVELMPFTLAYPDLKVSHFNQITTHTDPDKAEDISAKIRISVTDEDGNSNLLLEKVCSFKP